MRYDVTLLPGLAFREVGGTALLADLYLPKTEQPPPVAIYVHGGGFQFGSRSDNAETRLSALASHGFAVLSVDYRLSPTAHFPAPVQDVRSAVRWIRETSLDLGIDGERVALWGASAGATIAALAALTGDAYDHTDPNDSSSAATQAVVAWFPIASLAEMASRSWLEAQLLPFDFEAAFLGVDSVTEDSELALQASPLTWASSDSPPFLIAHGDRDRITPLSQSHALHDALTRAGAESTLLLLGGAGHEDQAFETPRNLSLLAGWLRATLEQT